MPSVVRGQWSPCRASACSDAYGPLVVTGNWEKACRRKWLVFISHSGWPGRGWWMSHCISRRCTCSFDNDRPGPLCVLTAEPGTSCQRQWACFLSVWAVLVAKGCDSCWVICPAVLLQWTDSGPRLQGLEPFVWALGWLMLITANIAMVLRMCRALFQGHDPDYEPGRSTASLSPFCRWGTRHQVQGTCPRSHRQTGFQCWSLPSSWTFWKGLPKE